MTSLDTALQRRADQVRCELEAQDDAWGHRRLDPAALPGRRRHGRCGRAGHASWSPPAPPTPRRPRAADRTLITVFLRGAADGLRILVPNTSDLGLDYLRSVRVGPRPGQRQPGRRSPAAGR